MIPLQTDRQKRFLPRESVLLIVTLFFWFALYTYPAILTPYLTELGASLTMAGVVVGSYGLAQTLLRLPAGIWSDHLRNKKVFIMAGLFASLISALGLYFFDQIGLILLFRAMAGIAAATWVHSSTLYLSYFSAQDAPRAMGRLSFINNLGLMTAMLAGSFLADAFTWRQAFLLAASVSAAGFLLSFLIKENKPAPDETEPPLSLRSALSIGRDRLLFWTSILALLSQLVNFATTQGFVPEYASQLGASRSEMGMLSAFALLPRAIAALLGGSLLARWFKLRTLIMFGFALAGLFTIMLPLVNQLPLLFVFQFIAGIGSGFQMTLLMSICTRTIPLSRKASAMGFYQAVYGIGMVTGPVLIGRLADLFSLGTGFVVAGTVGFLTAFLAALVLKPV